MGCRKSIKIFKGEKMKKIWVKIIPYEKNLVTGCIESGVDAILVEEKYREEVKKLGIIKVISPEGDLKLGKDVIEVEINSKEDEEKAVSLSKGKIVIVRTKDWMIIPLENLVAQAENIIAEVKNFEEAKTALGILEKGVDGILLVNRDINEIKKTANFLKNPEEKIKLEVAEITEIKILGMGDRVCIDTTTNMKIGEGMLIGNTSSAMFLVHSESVENPYVEPRPFRINAGGVHAYVLTPSNKTKYLSELKTGDEVLIVDSKGNTFLSYVGRTKTEKRPLILVKAECKGKEVSLILQNAETIRLTKPEGVPISVVDLKKKDRVLVYLEEPGRHFGIKIEETIEEK
jgi:3-dehydroquinate synthase II